MCPFCRKKKKNHTALKVVAIVVSVLAALAAAYVIFDKFFKDKVKKLIEQKKCACVEEECEETCEEAAAEVEEAEAETAPDAE